VFFPFRPQAAVAAFVHPLDPQPRTAILVPGFRSTRTTRVFPHGWDSDTEIFRPGAIAGTFNQLLRIADTGVQLSHAVICLTWNVDHLLTDAQRDIIWEGFGVPVFEQILGPGNVLLANECNAHAGLHITPAYKGPAADIARCACGRSSATAILVNYGRRFADPVAQVS
jgi:hypothetical protein